MLQHVRFGRDGHVYYREFMSFDGGNVCDTPPPPAGSHSPAKSTDAPQHSTRSPGALWAGDRTGQRSRRTGTGHAASSGGADSAWDAQQRQQSEASGMTPDRLGRPRCARDDVITTLNLPLLGVLRAVDEVSSFRAFVEVAIKQFFIQQRDSGKFDGLFMHRCAAGPASLLRTCAGAGLCPCPPCR